MKKLLILLFCFIYLAIPAFAAYYPIPANKQAAYKVEIEAVIKQETPKIKHNIDKVVVDYYNSKDEDYKYNLRSVGIDQTLWDLFYKMLNITNKYVPVKKDLKATGSYYDIEDVLYPYLKNNNISQKELIELLDYSDFKKSQMPAFP